MQRMVRMFPNLFTLLNLGCGILALVFIVHNLPIIAPVLVLCSALFDLFDGKK